MLLRAFTRIYNIIIFFFGRMRYTRLNEKRSPVWEINSILERYMKQNKIGMIARTGNFLPFSPYLLQMAVANKYVGGQKDEKIHLKPFLPMHASPLQRKNIKLGTWMRKKTLLLQLFQYWRIPGTYQKWLFRNHCVQTEAHNALPSVKIDPRNAESRACHCKRHPVWAAAQSTRVRFWAALFSLQTTREHRLFWSRLGPGALLISNVQYLDRCWANPLWRQQPSR